MTLDGGATGQFGVERRENTPQRNAPRKTRGRRGGRGRSSADRTTSPAPAVKPLAEQNSGSARPGKI